MELDMARTLGSDRFAAWMDAQPHGTRLRICSYLDLYPQHVRRLAKGQNTPNVLTAFRVEELTGGAVRARDFAVIVDEHGQPVYDEAKREKIEGGGEEDGNDDSQSN